MEFRVDPRELQRLQKLREKTLRAVAPSWLRDVNRERVERYTTPILFGTDVRITGYATSGTGREEEVKTNRNDVIKARMRELERELTLRENYGVDDHPDGAVLTWIKKFAGDERDFHYAAIKVEDRWYLTGSKVQGVTTWDELVSHWTDGIAVEQVLVADRWRDLRGEEEALPSAS